MIDQHRSAIDAEDDWLDAALRVDAKAHRDEYLDDGGFTARIMAALPAPVALPAWRRPALMVLWALAGLGMAFALPGVVLDVVYDVIRLVVGQSVSLTGMGTALVAIAVATWAAAAFVLRDD
jgi:hypothetical protein